MPADEIRRLDVRLPARQWGERITMEISGRAFRQNRWNANHAFTEGIAYIARMVDKSKAYSCAVRIGAASPHPGARAGGRFDKDLPRRKSGGPRRATEEESHGASREALFFAFSVVLRGPLLFLRGKESFAYAAATRLTHCSI
jgi:hypothetical protein